MVGTALAQLSWAQVRAFRLARQHLDARVPRAAALDIGSTKHVEGLLPDPALRGRVHRPQGWVSPVLVVGGRIDGVWRSERKGAELAVEIEPFGAPASATRRAAEDEAARLATFTGGKLRLSWA